MLPFILLFLFSSLILAMAGKWTIDALTRIAYFSHWREFVVAFFTVSLGAVAPEFFIGITSAFHGVPELSFGNIVGQNIILLTLTVAVSVFALRGSMEVESRTVRAAATYATIAAVLPLVLIMDGHLSRVDGIILMASFVLFVYWLFRKESRFRRVYEGPNTSPPRRRTAELARDIAVMLFGFLLIVAAAKGIITSALAFSDSLGMTLSAVGILIVAASTGFPETYFALRLARRGYSWMILGGLMGSVAMSSTLVLGVVALIRPMEIVDVSLYAVSRFFLVAAALLFLFFMRTKSRITRKEAVVLLALYAAFVAAILFVA